MKTLKKIALFAFISAVFVTCKKEVLTPSSIVNQPIFSFSGNINGANISWEAGVNNYYMYSSYSQDSVGLNQGVYSFIGTLQSVSTPNNSIQIIINDRAVTAKNASVAGNIDSSLSATVVYAYNKGAGISDTAYKVTFTPIIYSGSATAYTYSFGDHTLNTITTSSAAVTHIYNTLGNYTTSLTVDFVSCSSSTLSNPFNISPNPLTIDSIHCKALGGLSDSLKAKVIGGAAPYTYKWYFGDGDSSFVASPSHTYLSDSTYTVTLDVTDAQHNTASYNYSNAANDTLPTCRFDYTISTPTPIITVTNSDLLSDITIIYTSVTGVQYTSKNVSQPGSSNFYVISVSNYQNNLNNNKTIMLKVTFNCTLYPVLGGSPIQATNCTAVIAVAYH